MKFEDIRAAEARLLVTTYERNPICFVRGEGVLLFDEQGAAYLDMLSGIGVNALGHGHPAIQEALDKQSRKLLHVSNLFFHEGQAELALRLTEMTGLDRAFFCNSGTEAWEAALKLARAYATLRRSEGHRLGTKILALEHGFHGRTMGSVSTTHKQKYREPFEPLLPGVEFVRFNDIADLEEKFSDEVCAICLETVQGEGGIHPVSKEFFAAARKLTSETGALLIADEIQCGLGRTGEWCAYRHYGILPDVTTLAKPLGGGIPIGAMLCNEEAARAFTPGMHGTTFGGGPLACAVAIAVIDTMRRDNLLQHIQETGKYFVQQLQSLAQRHACIVDVRGMGLMLGVELSDAELAKQATTQMMERRILINRTDETVLRFLPPYIIEKKHIEQTIHTLDEILTNLTTVAASPAATHGARG
jgi:acetylornithine aminotransferase/acetylornithine/N-succinyldiaminopimelate aminotransferase